MRALLTAVDARHDEDWLVLPQTVRTLVLLLYATGLRISEALALTIADVDLREAILTIRETKFYKSRYVAFGPQLGNRLREFMDLRRRRQPSLGKDDPLFVALGPGHVDQSGMNNT